MHFFSANNLREYERTSYTLVEKNSNHILQRLLSRINKEISNFKSKKPNSPIRKGAKNLSKYFIEEDMEIKYKYIEIYSISLVGKCKLKPQ